MKFLVISNKRMCQGIYLKLKRHRLTKGPIIRNDDKLLIPLNNSVDLITIRRLFPECEELRIEEKDYLIPERPRSFKDLLKNVLGSDELKRIPSSFDIIGDIAIIEIPEDLMNRAEEIGKAIMRIHTRVKTVYAKAGRVTGEYRTRKLTLIAGEPKATTIHSEYGLRFKVDVLNTYFSPRLAYEHRRVAEEVRDGEIVVDMFTGVGPFAIHIASLRRCLVYAVDLNPAAYRLLIENIKLNKRNLKGEIIPVNADVRLLAKYIRNIANRVIMNLPEYSHEFVGTALTLLRKEGGVIHYYTFEDEPEELEKAVRKLRCLVEAQGRRILKVLKVRRVKSIAPHRWHIVVDALVS